MASALAGRRHLDGLEAALERAVLLDRLAELRGRGGADALNFAARKRRLQDVGGVQRTFRRTGAHQGVQLVDEDDGVLVLHQLLHDGLEPLFELAAVLGAGHDQRKVQRQDALVGQERRHVALGDALRQAFHDGGLAHARLADQHRVVLGAAAEDLHHALQFVVAADERVERVVHGGLREVAAEFRQQGAFLGTRGGHLLALRTLQLLADGGEPQPALVQNLGGEALLFAQQAQQQVLGPDVLVAQPLGFFGAVGQHALAFVAEGQVHRSGDLLADGGVSFDLLADGFHRRVGTQEPVGQRLVFPQQAQQQVFRLDVRAAELAGLVAREKDHPPRLLRVSLEHRTARPPKTKDTPYRCPGCESFPPAGTKPPFSMAQNAVATPRKRQIVRDENRGELVRAVQTFQELEDHLPGPEIQVPGRLVGEQNRRLAHQRAGQHDPLLLSARKFTGAVRWPAPAAPLHPTSPAIPRPPAHAASPESATASSHFPAR